MKILLMTWACDTEDVSEPEICSKWVREIAKDHDVTLFSVSRPDRFGCVREQFPDLDVIEWKDIWVPKWLEKFRAVAKPGYVPYYLKARIFLKRLLKEQKFDVIHQITPLAWRYPSPAAGLGTPFVRGPIEGGLPTPEPLKPALSESTPAYYKLRNIDKFRKFVDPILINSFAKSDLLLFAAPYVEELIHPMNYRSAILESDHGLQEHQQRPFQEPRAPKREQKIRFIYVGRVVRTKGLRDAIRGFAAANLKNQAELIVIGDGEDLKNCRIEAKNLNIEDYVDFRGWQSREDVEKHYQSADVFLFPSFREPTGGVFLEAMSHSLPTICCEYGGPEYFIDEDCGILVPPLEEHLYANEIGKAIDVLISKPEKRFAMSKAAWVKANNLFSWPQKRKRLTEIYQNLSENQTI